MKSTNVFLSIGTFTESTYQEWCKDNENVKIFVLEFNPILFLKLKGAKFANNKNIEIYQTTVGYEDVPHLNEVENTEKDNEHQTPSQLSQPQTQQQEFDKADLQSSKVSKFKTRFRNAQIIPIENEEKSAPKQNQMLAFLDQYVKEKNKKNDTVENVQQPVIQYKTIDYNIPINGNKSVNFYISNYLTSSSVLKFTSNQDVIKNWKYPPGSRYFNTVKILETPMIRLDTFFAKNKIKNVDFVRINSQGYCLQILHSLGSKIKNVKEFAIKVSVTKEDLYQNQSNRKDDVVNYLKNHNFRVSSIEKISYNQEEMIWFVNVGLEKIVGTKFYSFRTIS